jgi:signal transduction histidine kinase
MESAFFQILDRFPIIFWRKTMEDKVAPALGINARVYAEQVNLLFSSQPIGIAATILNSIIMITVFWHLIPHYFLISWGIVLLSISMLRTLISISYRNRENSVAEARRWGWIFVLGMMFAGLAWGSSAFWIFYVKAVEFHLLIAFVIGGMVSGAAATLSALRSSFYAFAIPGLIPLTVAFFSIADLTHAAMGIMLLIYLALLSVNAHKMYQVIRRSFQLRYEKDDLISRLELSKTETELAESELRILSGDLERQVLVRTRELEQANRDLDAFTYSVSHDLQGPVRVMGGYVKLILDEFGNKMDAELRWRFDVISENLTLMGDLIVGLLKLSQIGRTEVSFSQLDMKDLFEKVWHELLSINPGRHFELIENELAPAYGDKVLMRQVFYNLVSNAMKFTQYKENAIIEVGSYAEDGWTVYYVKDNGAGFNMEYSENLFKVFQRLHSASEYQGTGIGLAIVQRIVNRHGGRIWAEGQVNRGATFFFTLPSVEKSNR